MEFAVMLAVPIAVSLGVVLIRAPAVVGFVAAFGFLTAPLLVDGVARLRAHLRAGLRARSLDQQRDDLSLRTNRPVYVMSSLVRSTRPGMGLGCCWRCTEWERTGAVVLLHPANPDRLPAAVTR